MMLYIAEPRNLKTVMTLLVDPSQAIGYEAFHVFKIFVANPSKPPAVPRGTHARRVCGVIKT